MFQSLRLNSLIYIFHKGNTPFLELGLVVNISLPKPKYPINQAFGLPQEMVVDLVVKIKDVIVNYNGLPAQLDIADSYSNGESIVISDNKEAMNSEILNYKQKSLDAINSVDTHKGIIVGCDNILNTLNPEYAEKKLQQDEMITLKNLITEMTSSLAALTLMVGQLTEKSNELNVGNLGK